VQWQGGRARERGRGRDSQSCLCNPLGPRRRPPVHKPSGPCCPLTCFREGRAASGRPTAERGLELRRGVRRTYAQTKRLESQGLRNQALASVRCVQGTSGHDGREAFGAPDGKSCMGFTVGVANTATLREAEHEGASSRRSNRGEGKTRLMARARGDSHGEDS